MARASLVVLLLAAAAALVLAATPAAGQTEGKCIDRNSVHWDAAEEKWLYNSTDPYRRVRWRRARRPCGCARRRAADWLSRGARARAARIAIFGER